MSSSKYWRLKTIQKEEKIKRRKVVLFWLSFSIAFLSIMWTFFASPFFKITKIKSPENDLVTGNEIRKLVVKSAPFNLGENIFILSKNKIRTDLAAAFPAITGISIKKEPFHSLIVNFEKRVQVGIWCQTADDQTDNCYYLDKEGIIFKEAPQTEGTLILKIKDFKKKGVSLGDKVLNGNLLKFITEFNDKIAGNNQIKIAEFNIGLAENFDLKAVTDRGWPIYLDQNQNPAMEANSLFTILSEVVKNKKANLEYVDLRVSGRVFYKLR